MKEIKIMHIELKYFNPNTGKTAHFLFPDIESDLALDYYKDAEMCGCEILIWRLVPNRCIHIG